jgi:hypothetical protein
MSDIEKHDEEMTPEDVLVAGNTLFIQHQIEEFAKSFKQEVFDMIEEVMTESGMIGDMKLDITKLFETSDEAVSSEQLQTALDEVGNGYDLTTLETAISDLQESDIEVTEVTHELQRKVEKIEKFLSMAAELFA